MLNVMVSAGFSVNALIYYATGMPGHGTQAFALDLVSKLLDLGMIYFFYQYVKATLDFKGKLARWADKGIPILLVLENLVLLSNIIHPVTYDFFMIDDDHLGIVIADVSGKGVPAALFMMISKTIVKNYAMFGIGAAETLSKAKESLCAQNKMEMFVTTWIVILELSTGKMSCASAGHEYPAICREGKYELFKDRHGFVLGGLEGANYHEYEISLAKGDRIFVYTDGVPEATNANNDLTMVCLEYRGAS